MSQKNIIDNGTALVSVITPLHNAAQYIGETIESVLGQHYTEWELIIVDDCSTDDSLETVQRFCDADSRVQLIKLAENNGAAVARNIGLAAAKGRYIAFLDSDDLWLPDKLEKQLGFMQETGCPFTYTAYEKIDQHGQKIGYVGVPYQVSYGDMLKTCYLGCLTVMLDKEYFSEITMPLIRRRQDYGLWLKLLKEVDHARGLQENLAQYRVHTNSISANKLISAAYTWRLYRRIEHLSLLKSVYYFLNYCVRGVLRHRFPALARKLKILD